KYGIWTEPVTSLALAAGVAALLGLSSGWVLLRTTGLTLLMLTLCTMGLLEELANMGAEYTGGYDGLDNLPIPPLFGLFEFNPLYPKTQYLYALGVLFLGFVFVRTLVYSPFGQSLTGIRENMLRMHAVGAPVRWRLVTCYAISAAIAGIAGGLWAQTNAYVNLSALGLDRAATILIVLVLAGYRRLPAAPALPRQALPALPEPRRRAPAHGHRAVRTQRHDRPGGPPVRADPQQAPMTEPLLETRSLSLSFGALAATRDVNFRLEPGARHALIGPNGAGKTTLINLLTGVLRPSAGHVLFKGRDITAMPQAARVKLGVARTFP